MNASPFTRSAGEMAVEAWRPLDRLVHRWVIRHGGSPLLAETAAWASLAEGHGDAALPLASGRHGMPPIDPADIAQLREEPLVASGADGGVRPFALDAAGRFYLWRNHADECSAAMHVQARRAASSAAPAATELQADLDALFHGERRAEVQPQREAVRSVCGKRLFVLTGGPGTGKTTTVLRMLLMLQRQAGQPLAIRIAAPTGKAAQRLVQSLRQGKQNLLGHPALPLPPDWQPLLDAIPDGEALTVHRLLGYQPWRNAFRRSARDPIAADVVVVDEASMIDLAMLRCLLAAVRPDATLVLVGDADQLTSVATGSVLLDLVGAFEAAPRGDLLRLAHSFRAERELVAINEAVRGGDAAALAAAVRAAGGAAALHPVADERQLRQRIAGWAAALAADPVLRGLPQPGDHGATPASAEEAAHAALAALAERQLLSALREGPFGAVALNAAIEAALRRAWGVPSGSGWYAGRAVIITRNDYAAGLFNGDVGICLAAADGTLRVWFGAAEDAGLRSFAPHTLPAHEGAFAITIHKSQGSEYRHAAVLLPPRADSRILSRQLLYTGVSRAREAVGLWASPDVLATALATEVNRSGGLQPRLLESGNRE
ncbi:MAG: exodeoxyribonuclease V subunit alpha [Xanthomonadales bacterium]|nr:exodeoxyribonuclease V subunit alpha [Xanthomonadales bacterium]